jgi:hypothetical protein
MSRGITFRLLKKSKNGTTTETVDRLIDDFVENNKNCEYLYNRTENDNSPKYPKFINSDCSDFDVINTENGKTYYISLEISFNSYLSSVRDVFCSEYGAVSCDPWKSQIIIDDNLSSKIKFAIDYVLLGKYDRDIENLIDNIFIGKIGELNTKYSEYKYGTSFDKDYFEDCTKIIQRLRTIITAYMEADDKENYMLIAELWG